MTLGDLITAAGRLKRTADITLEVYRVMRAPSQEPLAIPEIHSIRVDSAYLVGHDPNRIYANNYIPGFTYLVDRAAAFKLMPYDRVVVNMDESTRFAVARHGSSSTRPPRCGSSSTARASAATRPSSSMRTSA